MSDTKALRHASQLHAVYDTQRTKWLLEEVTKLQTSHEEMVKALQTLRTWLVAPDLDAITIFEMREKVKAALTASKVVG